MLDNTTVGFRYFRVC